MRVAGISEVRSNMAELLGGDEPLLVTRRGKVSGLYLPLRKANRIPQALRREFARILSTHLANRLAADGRTTGEIPQDFAAFRRRRR